MPPSPVNVSVLVSFGDGSNEAPPANVQSALEALHQAVPQTSVETEAALAATFATKLANAADDIPSSVLFVNGHVPGPHRLNNGGEWVPGAMGIRWHAEDTDSGHVWHFFLQS